MNYDVPSICKGNKYMGLASPSLALEGRKRAIISRKRVVTSRKRVVTSRKRAVISRKEGNYFNVGVSCFKEECNQGRG